MMNDRTHTTLWRAGRLAAGALLGVSALGTSAATAIAAHGGSGSIWTTKDACPVAATQDVNHYGVGDTVYLRGKNFAADAPIGWTITGLPGGASSDPGMTVALGTGSTDGDGAFCVNAYVIAAGDAGEYSADVTQGATSKNDNYRVDVTETVTTTTTESSSTTESGTTTESTTTEATTTEATTTEATTTTKSTTIVLGTTDAGTTDPGTGGTTDPGTGGTTDPGAADPGTGGTTDPGAADPGSTTDPGVTHQPTQQVLGATDTNTPATTIEMPPTDTFGGSTGTSLPAFLIAGLAAVTGMAILLAPTRRRTADRQA